MTKPKRMTKPGQCGAQLVAALLAGSVLGFSLMASAAPVTEQRLINAANEPQNWLTVYKSYNNHRHSQLSQINRNTVAGLKVKFAVALGGLEEGARKPGQQQNALVNDGFMYVNNAWNQIRKIDVRSGSRGVRSSGCTIR